MPWASRSAVGKNPRKTPPIPCSRAMLVRCDAPHQAVNRALEFGIALSLHANTDMLDRGSNNAVRKAGSRTRSIPVSYTHLTLPTKRIV